MSPGDGKGRGVDLTPQLGYDGKPPGATSWDGSVTEAGTRMRSYYGRPVIKPPVWKPEVPFYLFTGGLGGAASVLAMASRLAGNRKLARRMQLVGTGAELVSPLLLTADLGRPERFFNMLRLFKVTSPMNVGSWILTASSSVGALATALELVDRAPRLRLAAEAGAAALGPAMATYTAVLISNTSVPAWHEARREMPLIFAFGSAASAGAAGAMVTPPRHAGPARRLAIASTAAAAVATEVMEKRLGMVAEPYKEGLSGQLMRASKLLTGAGAAVLAAAGRGRGGAVAGGTTLFLGEVLLRWGIFKAGDASARDPKYTVAPQRRRAEEKGSKASRREPRQRGAVAAGSAEERETPEALPGAGPAGERAPEHPHGKPFDEPQPSAPHRGDLEEEEEGEEG